MPVYCRDITAFSSKSGFKRAKALHLKYMYIIWSTRLRYRSGLRLDMIKTVLDIHDLLQKSGEQRISISRPQLEHAAHSLIQSHVYEASGEASWKAFLRIITADRSALPDRIISTSYKSKFLERMTCDLKSIQEIFSSDQSYDNNVRESVEEIVKGKTVFAINGNIMYLTESGCKSGNIVCFFLGGELPFILQQLPSGKFQLHGEADVHSKTDGEVQLMEKTRDYDNAIVNFVLVEA